jgi:hypothetical protein
MFVSLNKPPRRKDAAAFWLVLPLAASCAFADIRPLSYTTEPSAQNAVLGDTRRAVSLHFETEMRRAETEKAFSVLSREGAVEGDLVWRARTLEFHPAGGWIPGIRYTLCARGTVFSLDGREERLDTIVHFYALSADSAPRIESYTPRDGDSVGVTPEEGARLCLLFSRDMDRASVEEALSVAGLSDMLFVWRGARELELTSAKKLVPWTAYRWTLGKGAKSAEGIPVSAPESGTFITGADSARPAVRRVYPALRGERGDGAYLWLDSGASIEDGLDFDQAAAVEFSKPMDEAQGSSIITVEPSLGGRVEWISSTTLVFISGRPPEAGRRYLLRVRADTKDRFGLALGEEYQTAFTAAIPALRVLAVSASGLSTSFLEDAALRSGAVLTPRVHAGEKSVTLQIQFSASFDTAAQMAAAEQITLTPLYPPGLGWTETRWINWSGKILEFDFEGVMPGKTGAPHFYKLTIPGGAAGVHTGGGQLLPETLTLYLEALP